MGDPQGAGQGAGPRWQPPEWLPPAPPEEGFQIGPYNQPGYRPGYGAPSGGPGYEGFDAPFGSSGEYGAYGPPPGSQMPYAQSAPEYVPPLTAKTPAAPGAGGWSGPGQGYSPDQDAYGPYGAGGAGFGAPEAARAPASLAHAQVSSSTVTAGEYVPGGSGFPAGAQAPTPLYNPAREPYIWEAEQRAPRIAWWASTARWILTLALLVVAFLSAGYAGVSAYAASQLVYAPQVSPTGTPADFKMDYKPVTFTSRTDHVALKGWFIPGIVAGKETDARTIIVVHGKRENRTDPGVGLLSLSVALAKNGFAVLAFDMRGSGDSQAAPLSLGQFEQRDVLGAVDFLLTGDVPYSTLGRPKVIGGWGVSMGAATLLLAAAQDPAIKAVVADSAYSDIMPILEREIPKQSHLPAWFTPGILRAAQVMYGIDFTQVHPVSVVAKIAPRPIFFIQGANDTFVPTSDLTALANAAQQGSGAQVTTWSVPNATHAQAYKVAGQTYVTKVVGFFNQYLLAA